MACAVAGWVALALATAMMLVSAALFVAGAPARSFVGSPPIAVVIEIGVGLFLVASVFQLFDGVQTVTTGALRGLGDTKTPMFVNLVGHWAHRPAGRLLCCAFNRGWGVQGLWAGLALGLILIGAALLGVWHRQSRSFRSAPV